MTKCRIHPYEFGAGVCASCLRERLLAVIAARECSSDSPEPPPPPHVLPRSVSPHAGHRHSVGSGPSPARTHRHQRFFSTPQVGPFFDYDRDLAGGGTAVGGKKRSSLLSLLFGSRTPRSGETRRSASWILGLLPGRRSSRRSDLPPDKSRSFPRGMSPERYDDADSVTYGRRRQDTTPVRRFPPASPARGGIGVSGFAMCLSPLVRASPKPAAEVGFSAAADPRGCGGGTHDRRHRHQVSLEPSRSRKLADMGRFR